MAQSGFQSKAQFGYRRHADQDRTGGNIAEYPVVVIGVATITELGF